MTDLKLTNKQMDILDDWYKKNYGHVSQTFLSDSASNNLAKKSGLEKSKVNTYIKLRRSYDREGKSLKSL